MKKHQVLVFGMLLFLVLMMPVMTSNVQAFNTRGPTHIPGNLIPFPSMMHDQNDDIKIPPVIPSAKK